MFNPVGLDSVTKQLNALRGDVMSRSLNKSVADIANQFNAVHGNLALQLQKMARGIPSTMPLPKPPVGFMHDDET